MTFSDFRAQESSLYRYFKMLKFLDIAKMGNVLFLHDIYKGTILPAVTDTFDINISRARNTCSSTLGHINSVYKGTTTYGIGSLV